MKLFIAIVLFGCGLIQASVAQEDEAELTCGNLYYRTLYLDEKQAQIQ